MEYKITMPKLTDTMESGLIVRWLKKEGDYVERNEPIVEIETEKAIQEVPSFKSGILKKILVPEGEEVEVGKPIAILEVKSSEKVQQQTTTQPMPEHKEQVVKKEQHEEEEKKEKKEEKKQPQVKVKEGLASPLAKKLAAELGIDLKKLQEKGEIPSPAHEEDILSYFYGKFFTSDALEIAKEYEVSLKDAVKHLGENITKEKLLKYLKEKSAYKIVPVSQIQKRLIEHLSKSTQVPTYRIYETFDTKYIDHSGEYTLTAWIVKIIGDVMQNHYRTRIYYNNGNYKVYISSNIAIAVAVDEELFSPVIKNVSEKSLKQIQEEINQIKEKAKNKRFEPSDFEDGTFAVSNLGMFGISMFDAIVPYNYSGISAVGAEEKKKIKITTTFDHRIINGKEAALFIKELKEKFKDKSYIEGLIK